ncbi:hypothetical protein TNIN_216861 [Trichonephila inaurata madagascariensis]|uniref:Uncharacterized protein n=1 Tax=Trichonephila inaurata madagascariensis TaxID=2747483 RepID=A0A8X6YDH5_9ARAC|nr:hypothetical protein TNIN_216861 [Trichonephila inaurata madagascariensis]
MVMNQLSSQSSRASECAQTSSARPQDFDQKGFGNEYYSRCETFPQSALTGRDSKHRFESDEDFVHSISSPEDLKTDEEVFSSVRQW